MVSGSTATTSRWPARSTPVPTRFNATSSPSVCSVCRGEVLIVQFAFTEDQLLFRDAVRDFLANECKPEAVRAAWENEIGRIPGMWQQLGEMGVIGLLAPEAAGGFGLSEVDLVGLLEA